MTSPLSSSAWGSGKLILWGEHAVVYDQPAVALALPQGLCARLTKFAMPQEGSSRLRLKTSQASISAPERQALEYAFERALAWIELRTPVETQTPVETTSRLTYECSIEGELPFKVGLGSSAALSVALSQALAELHQLQLSPEELIELVFEMERVFHERPSGLDHYTSIRGGAIRYQRTSSPGSLEPLIQPLEIGKPFVLLLSWIPREGSTADAVRGVAQRRNAHSSSVDALFVEIGEVANQGCEALVSGDLSALGTLLDHNHELLKALGVVHSELDTRCDLLRARGALGAKMSGAGHGGVCFGLFSHRMSAERAAQELGDNQWIVEINASKPLSD